MTEEPEWDEEKAKSNKQKHGIDFSEAANVFLDEYEVIWDDPLHSEDEVRLLSVGNTGGQLVTVSYTQRDNRLRIISARLSNAKEQELYYSQFQ